MARKAKKVRVLKSQVVFRGPVFYVSSDRVQEPSGIVARRDMVRHPGSVVIMAVDGSRPQLRVLLARQYRYAAGQELWELPAGRIDSGEQPQAAAKRELLEETGYAAEEWVLLGRSLPNPALHSNRIHHFLARGARRVRDPEPDENESLATTLKGLEETKRLLDGGLIDQSMVVAAFYYFDAFFRKNESTIA